MAFAMEVPGEEAAIKSEVLEPFSMKVPDKVAIKKEVLEQVKPVPQEEAQLLDLAERNVALIVSLDIDEPAKTKDILQPIESFGAETMKRSAKKNSLLQMRVGNLSKDGDEGGLVAKGLTDLQRELKDLDPGPIDFSLIDLPGTGIFGKLFDPVRTYFAKFQKADQVIAEIIESLDKGKTSLDTDNTTLVLEQQEMRVLTKKLMKEILLATLMDELIEKWIEAAKARKEDLERVKFVEEEILFPLRQRVMDMQQMIVVNQQGVIATEIVIRNNKELIRGVERAQVVTISALRTSMMVASALYNQKIVLIKIQRLIGITDELIQRNAIMLKVQGAEIRKRAMEPISVETLKTAFADAMEALDAISAYKPEALSIMNENINQLKELTAKGEERIQQIETGHKLEL